MARYTEWAKSRPGRTQELRAAQAQSRRLGLTGDAEADHTRRILQEQYGWPDIERKSGFERAVGGLGDVAKWAAIPLAATGVGAPLAAAVGGLGALAGNLNDYDDFGWGDVLGAAGHAAAGYGAGKLRGGAGKVLGAAGGAGSRTGAAGGATAGANAPSWTDRLGKVGEVLKWAGAGRPGGVDAKHLLGAGAAAVGLRGSHQAGKRSNEFLGEQMNLAREQADLGRELIAGARPVRQQAESDLLASLKKGRRKTPNMAGFADTQNPFRKRFPMPATV